MKYNLYQAPANNPLSLRRILHEMNEAGGFEISMLASTEGLPMATAPDSYNGDLTAAMVALIQRASNDTKSQLKMAEVEEVTICDRKHIRLVCRYLPVGKEKLILVVKAPPGCPYRRITNQAIRRIKRLLS